MAAGWLLAAQMAWGAYEGAGTFTKITSRADLTDGYYVILNSTATNAMNNVNAGTFFTPTVVVPSANTVTDPAAAIVWFIATNAYGGHTLYNEASAQYVSYSGTKNYAYSVAAVNGTTGVWTFVYGDGVFDVANVATPTRLLQYNASAPRFACYTTAQQKLSLYKNVAALSNAPALPTIDPLSDLFIEAGQTSNLWVVAREADGDALALVASNLPPNATFTEMSGTGAISNRFTFSPDAGQAGQVYAVEFYASDLHGTASRTLNITVASDDPWADYYAACYVNGVLKTGADLKSALHDIIAGHTSFSYTAAENILKDIDECPTNSSMVQLLYLQHGRAKSNFGGGIGQWNREHVWANSHGINDTLPAYSDVHHLHPTDVQVNSTRGNLDFDTVSGWADSYSYDTGAFEPPDAGKGDVARAMFYMAVRYNGTGDGAFTRDLELTNVIPTSGPLFGKLNTLLDWNELDPVDDYEIRRNNLIHSAYQKNRNPFVDHPEWARTVFDTNYLALPALTAFSAVANGAERIDVSFAYTGTGDGVVIVWNNSGNFSDPSGAVPAVGQSFAGGTVLYKGSASPQSHAGLPSCQTVYYTCWAYSGTDYSTAGLTASATTGGADAPASVWASVTNATDFTAAWSEVPGASGYRIDVSTDSRFSDAGAGGTLIDEDFADFSDWADFGTTIDTTDGHFGAASPCRALVNGTTLTSPGVNYPTQMVFFADASNAGNGQTTTNYYSVDGGAQWRPLGTFTVSADGATVTQALTAAPNLSGFTNVRFRFVSAFSTWYLDDVKVTGGQPQEPSYVAGYSNRLVSGTTRVLVTGLTAGVTYYFRVASEPNCAGGYSALAEVTTLEAPPADLTPFEHWLQDRTLDPHDSRYGPDADADGDGMSTWEEYLADTNPDDADSVLLLMGTYSTAVASGMGTGQMRIAFPVSTNRYYQFIYSTNLARPTLTNHLGWGVSGMAITNDSIGTWYGTIRVLLGDPD